MPSAIRISSSSSIKTREDVHLERSTLSDWIGKSTKLLEPLADAIGEHVLAGTAIHQKSEEVSLNEFYPKPTFFA